VKKLLLMTIASLLLAGCVAVPVYDNGYYPYHDPYAYGYYGPYSYGYVWPEVSVFVPLFPETHVFHGGHGFSGGRGFGGGGFRGGRR